MLSEIALGQYFPGNSALHRMDPRVKIVCLLFFMVGIFVFSTAASYALFSAVLVCLIILSGLPFRMMAKSVKPLWWILLFTFAIHLFSVPGEEMFRFWKFSVTWEGLRQGSFVSLRLILLILFSSLLTFTTSPLKLTDGLEDLLSPFKRIGVPSHELAMMMTIALRFIPTILSETDKIIKAQRARGADFSSGSLMARMKLFVPILVPLFVSAFRRAEELAIAMESRCYRGGEGRTRRKELCVGFLDYLAMFFAVLLCVVLIFLQGKGW